MLKLLQFKLKKAYVSDTILILSYTKRADIKTCFTIFYAEKDTKYAVSILMSILVILEIHKI